MDSNLVIDGQIHPVDREEDLVEGGDEGFEDEARAEELRQERLNELGMGLSRLRSYAIRGREESGIEREWQEDLEYYEGIDDANRHEFADTVWRNKPPGQAATRTTQPTASTIFINITRAYCDAASARITDMLQPVDDRAWDIKPTPNPKLIGMERGEIPLSIQQSVRASLPDAVSADEQIRGLQGQAKQIMLEAREHANNARIQIDDWLNECQYHAEVRRVIEDATKVGTGILKGPCPTLQRSIAYKDGQLRISEELAPESRRISFWNLYPDPDCGQDIHKGSRCWERDDLPRRCLMDLLHDDRYIRDQIVMCLEEGPQEATGEYDPAGQKFGLRRRSDPSMKGLFEIWYYYGSLPREDLEAVGVEIPEHYKHHEPFVLLEMVNNRVIKAALNPLDTGEFPYDLMVYQRREGMPWGMGVSRQIRAPQRMVVGAVRNMMDNAGIAGGPMLEIPDDLIPTNGRREVAPRKMWIRPSGMDPNEQIRAVSIDIRQAELQAIVELGLKLAEDTTGLPMLMQGHVGSAPDTLGGMQMLHNNASAVLRRIARIYDDMVTERHIGRYYRYLLQYGEDDSAKGDFKIHARGSSALVDRDIQNMMVQQMATVVMNPVFGADPKKWFSEYLKSCRLDPERIQYDDEEWRQVVEQLAQQAQQGGDGGGAVAAAQIRAEAQMAVEQMRQEAKLAELQQEQVEADKERAFRAAMAEVDAWMDQEDKAGRRSIEMDRLRARFAELREKLATQIMLSREAMANKAAQGQKAPSPSVPDKGGLEVKTPPTEPVGRAPDGASYQL